MPSFAIAVECSAGASDFADLGVSYRLVDTVVASDGRSALVTWSSTHRLHRYDHLRRLATNDLALLETVRARLELQRTNTC